MEESHPLSERLLEAEGELGWLLPSLAIQDSNNAFYLYLARVIWQGRLGKVVLFTTEQRLEISLVQLLSCVWLFETPWTVVWQASLSITNSRSLLKLMPLELVMPSNHLIQYFGHLMWKTDSLEKTLMLGKIEGRRRRRRAWDGWMASPTGWTEFEQAPGFGDVQGSLVCCSPWGHKELDMTKRLNWTTSVSIDNLKQLT